ncbi:MAG: CBS domain-containing protein [Anaerolineales bacterium]|nr:CBS domain-containing protein [Anaerolineales bacterium]
MKQELVKNWMNSNVITISPDTALPDAHRLMTENRIRRLPVLDNGKLVGIVTLGDVREAEPSNATSLSIWELNYLLSRLPIAEIMTEAPQTVGQDATVGEAAHIMMTHKVSGLPVVDNAGIIVGIITESDIFRMVAQEWQS